MIELKIYDWVDLGDSMQLIDVYSKSYLINYFKFFYLLNSYSNFPILFIIILKLVLFLQVMTLSIINLSPQNDYTLQIVSFLSNISILQGAVLGPRKYILTMILMTALFLVMVSIIIYIILCIRCKWKPHSFPMQIINFLNETLFNYLIGPFVNIFLSCFQCSNGVHPILMIPCYKHWIHLLILIASLIYLAFFLVYTLLLSIYYSQIGSIRDSNMLRINCNFELYFTLLKVIAFVSALIIKHYLKSTGFLYGYQIILFSFEFILLIYIHKQVLYYNTTINLINKCGWMFVCWFTFLMMIKFLIGISDITLFLVIGWVIIGVFNYYYDHFQIQSSLTKTNLFEVKSLQAIEYYVTWLLNYKDTYDIKIKILMKGVITRFENWLQLTNKEKLEKYKRIGMNSHLNSKTNNQLSIPILSMIYIIYEHHLEKSLIKTQIFFVMGYFLIKHLKNWVYAISLCSKIKVTNHKDLYLKYCLTEEIKQMLTMKMIKGLNHSKDSIKHIDISSVILYNIYIDSFKLKIYDAACNQIDYFDTLKNNTTTNRTTLNLIKIGKDIIALRKEIVGLWNKINELNPFSIENEKDYMLYFETIIQDNEQAKQEEKKHHTNLVNLYVEKSNLYYSLFIKEQTAILLIDGYTVANHRVIYSTPNFSQMFNYPNKEILNISIDEFIVKPVASFHNDLIQENVKYLNLQSKFATQKDFLFKGKTGGVFSIKAYIKSLPNLSFGLVYITSITKQPERNFIIVLDKDFKVCGLSDILSQGGGVGFTVNNNYGLSESLCNHHIASVLPDILLQMRYKNQKFTIKKKDIDLKGNLYPTAQYRGLDEKIDHVLDRIKQCGKLQSSEDTENNDSIHEYNTLLSELNAKYLHPFSIFYKITLRSFMNSKHQYYRIYITKDLISVNELSALGNNAYSNNDSCSKYKEGHRRQSNRLGAIQEISDYNHNHNEHSHKQIKLHVNNKQSQNKEMVEKEDHENGDKNNNDNQSKPKETVNINSINMTRPVIKSTPEYTAFRMIKQGILNKTELIQSRQMKTVTLTYVVISMALMLINYFLTNNSFNEMNEFLFENSFFNQSKIVDASVYFNGINAKMVKYDFYTDTNPFCVGKCSILYNNQLTESINEFKTLKENNSYFYEDYKQIFNQKLNVTLQVFKAGLYDKTVMDVNNVINAIISNGLMFIPHLDEYLKDKPSKYDINNGNIVDLSFVYFRNGNISGFNETIKTQKMRRLKSSYACMILQFLIFSIAIVFLALLILKMLSIEQSWLRKIIFFRSSSFDLYIKRLEDLKKKLRNETGEDDTENDNQNDESKSCKNNNSLTSDKERVGFNKKHKENGSDKNKTGNDKTKKSSKHHRSKQAKLQQKQNEKITMMSNFFYKYNLLFSFKVVVVFIISLSYYLVALLLNESRIKNLITLDNSMNSIQSIFNQTYSLFMIIKMFLFNYTNYEIEKLLGIKALNDGEASYTINGKVFTSIDDITNSYYKFNVPDLSSLEAPKVGNLLMPLINSAESNSKGVDNINNLFNGDACGLVTKDDLQYEKCTFFWSSILLKGLDQSITQMGVVMNTVLDHILQLNSEESDMTIQDLFEPDSVFSQVDFFINFYLYPGFKQTVIYFTQIRFEGLYAIKTIFLSISLGFVGAEFILMIIVIIIIHSNKEVFDAFLNFIAIFPYQYLIEDDNIVGDFNSLEKILFHI